jgi:hypothetical protein
MQANLDKFVEGDFISVTLSDARARLKDIAKEDISSDAYNSFRALANHRNKMIHFFHKALESDDAAKTEIVIEQCRAWFHLHRLLRGWKGYFSDFDTEIRRCRLFDEGTWQVPSNQVQGTQSRVGKCAQGGQRPPRVQHLPL